MIKFYILNIKLIFSNIPYLIASAFVLYSAIYPLHLGLVTVLREVAYFYFLAVYLLSSYAERFVRWPQPALLSPRGLALTALILYTATAPVVLITIWLNPLILAAPLLATLRKTLVLLASGLALIGIAEPVGATVVAIFEVLSRARIVTTMGRGSLRMSTPHPAIKLLIASAFLVTFLVFRDVPNVTIYGLTGYSASFPPPLSTLQAVVLAIFHIAALGLVVGAALDAYLDSYLRTYYVLRRRISIKPFLTLLWTVMISMPVCLFPSCKLITHVALLILVVALVWGLKPNLFNRQEAVLYLIPLFFVGPLLERSEVLLLPALMPILPWLSERVRHVLSTS
ncbi:hypothetical protein Pogu_1873 [Pyrobaculum oguniense TE7]|uniref:Uncharacterized protein n=1 Tax=Pyrobaculum oguniense (strain DSM 13380 / JCM 10595 / TE7) TaxID=698757 RepID=H6QAX7_PYROT|nr:hypothetical protein Pogu_1873 [Pyrobaculum oguniense TE7]